MKVLLRKVELDDGKLIVKWRNNPKVNKHCIDKAIVTEESNAEFYNNNVLTGKYIQYIVEKIDEEFGVFSYPIATMYLKDMDKVNGTCELGLFTNDDEEWNDESKYKALLMLLDKAFNELEFQNVFSYVYKECSDEIELLEKVGFVKGDTSNEIVKMVIHSTQFDGRKEDE